MAADITLDLYLLPSPGSFSSLTDMRSKRDSRTRVAILRVNRMDEGVFEYLAPQMVNFFVSYVLV
jgi:hypothetical protein